MRKVILFLLLVIILVSLNWFKELLAGDLSSLKGKVNPSEIELIKKYPQTVNSAYAGEYYKSSLVLDSSRHTEVPLAYSKSDSLKTPFVQGDLDYEHLVTDEELVKFEDLRPFGLKLFRGTGEIVPPDDIATLGDYILGPGDNIVLYLWGRVEQEYNLTIDREGKVFMPKVGELLVWGKTLEEFKAYARKKISGVYSEFELNVALGKIRSIRIYITGEVNRPGAYTVSSLTSLFNALYLAGGPNENGTMRNIRLMREGKLVAEVDLYKFLLEGDNSLDIRLQSGDAIFIPVAGSRVAIRGEIRRPAIYELKGGETALALLTLAGQPTAEAHLERVMMERISGLNEWSVLDLNLDTTTQGVDSVVLKDGDRLTVYSIFEAKKNMVAIFGQVKHPGYYERNDATRIGDLIERGDLQDYDVYYKQANLFRRYADWRTEIVPVDLNRLLEGDMSQNILLQDRDSLYVYSIEDVDWVKKVSIDGEIKKPGAFKYYDRMSAYDLIFLAGSFNRSASLLQGELARIDSLGKTSLIYVSLDEESLRHTYLKEDDRLYIRQIPEWPLHRTVKIEGEVSYPGEYMLSGRDETLFGLINRAGGFNLNAFPRGIILKRQSIDDNLQRLQIAKVLEKSSPVVEDSAGNLKREMLFEYELQAVNRVVIDIDRLLDSKGQENDVVLEPGDYIFVPSIPSGISVLGAVGSSGTIKYCEGKKVKYYIERAGNYVSQSNKKDTQLIRASGEVLSGGGISGKRVEMGDIIVVPTKIKREHDWSKTFTIALSATTSLLITVLLIDKL